MSAREKMTWNSKQQRWFKKYQKRQYAVSCKELGTPPTKEASLSAANAWWEQKLIEIGSNRPQGPSAPDFTEGFRRLLKERVMIDIPLLHEPGEQTALHRQVMAFIDGLKQQPFELSPEVAAAAPRLKVGDTVVRLPTEADLDNLRTIGAAVKTCVDRKAVQVASGERSVGRWDAFRCHLEHFAEWAGSGSDIATISGTTLEDYHSHLLAEIGKRNNDSRTGMSRAYAKGLFGSARQFVRWAWGRGLVELPKNIDSRDFAFGASKAQKIEVVTVAEIKKLLGGAPDAMKLYLLLMLNCGMQQKDISDLQHDEVDWKQGLVTRKRSKTGDHANVPTVKYKLWKETFALLKKCRSKHPTLALTTSVGNPLKIESIVDGKNSKTDSIQSAYRRLQEKLNIEGKDRRPLKLLRKTSPSLLEKHSEFSRYSQYFLGHAPKSVAERHYVKPDDIQFFAALEWLGKQYGLASVRPRRAFRVRQSRNAQA